MREYVARLLQRSEPQKKLIQLILDGDQAEMIEKLSLFFSRETNEPFTENRVIEEAVRMFVNESAQYIAEEFDMDIRETSLSEMRRYQSGTTVDICVLDTVVVPFQDTASNRAALLKPGESAPLVMDCDKLDCTKYIAFYMGTPTCAITHYAGVTGSFAEPGGSNKVRLRYDKPEELRHRLEWENPAGKGLRRPRYTMLKMLLEARMIEELF